MDSAAPSEALIVYVTIIVASTVVSAGFHAVIKSFVLASFVSAIVIDVLAFAGDTVWNGYVSGWWLIIVWTLGSMAFVTALAVGWLMDKLRWSARARGKHAA